MKRLAKFLWVSCVVLLVSLAVALSVARVLLPEMSQYKGELESLAREQFNYDIRIGSLGASWKRFSPILSLNDVTIPAGSVSDQSLEVREVHVSLDLLNTLRTLSWRTHRIELVGFHLTVYRSVSGQWSLTRKPPESSSPESFRLFLKQKHIGFEDATISWIDEKNSGLRRVIRNVKFNLMNKRQHRRFSLEADLPESLGEHILMIGDMTGHVDVLSWAGPLYVQAEKIDVQEIAKAIFDKPVDYQARLDAEIWLTRSQGKLSQVSGDFHANNINTHNSLNKSYTLDELSSRFIWWSSKRGWRLNVDKIVGFRDQQRIFDNTAMSGEMVYSDRRFNAAVSELSIAELSQIAQQVPGLPSSANDMLINLRPKGQLLDIQIETIKLKTGEQPFNLKADFENIVTESWGKIPGISGISGSVDGHSREGVLTLNSHEGVVSSTQLFRAPIEFKMQGNQIHWKKYADRLRLSSADFSLISNGDVFNSRYQLDWLNGERVPWIDAQIVGDNFKLNKIPAYLPVGIMQPGLVKWFDQSFKKGQLHDARIVIQGKADEFPFENNKGIFQANLDIRNGFLDYSKQWGKLENFSGSLVFKGFSMQANVKKGRILHSPIRNTQVAINDFRSLVLDINGRVGGRLPAMLGYITRSPLDEQFGAAIRAIETKGSADLDLSLSIPLKESTKDEFRLKGNLELKNNQLIQRGGSFSLSDLRGRIAFTETTYSAKNILASFRGNPATVDVTNSIKNKEAQIKIKGPLKLLDYVQSFDWPLIDHFHGSTVWQLTLHIPTAENAKNKAIWVGLQSDLLGIKSSLPLPFSKSKNEKLALEVKWIPDDLTQPVNIKYGDKADTIIKLDRMARLTAGDVRLYSKQPAVLPEGKEFRVSGHLPVGAPLQWIALFTSDKESETTGKMIPLIFDLSVDRLALTKYFVRALKIKSVSGVPWKFRVSGVGAAGTLQLNLDSNEKVSRIVSDLKYLSIRSSDLVASTVWGLEKINPASIPDITATVGDMLWDGKALGKLSIRSRHKNGQFIAEEFSVESDALKMKATGIWSGQGSSQTTQVNADIIDGKLESLLRIFGGSDAITGGQLTGVFTGGWPGSPAEFDFNGLSGELKLRTKGGRIVDADPGAGKLLGLLSLKSLPRRLFFDFSDLSKAGFSFDKIDGSFVFNDGDALTHNLEISGPAADIMIAGRIGMVAQDYDELVTIIPSITSTLPLAGAIAGGPAIGAVVLLAERILGKQIDKMSKIEYQVTGSWDDPKYEKLKTPAAKSFQEDDLYDTDDEYDE